MLLPACKVFPITIKFLLEGLYIVIHVRAYLWCTPLPWLSNNVTIIISICLIKISISRILVNLSYSSWYTYVQDAKRLKAHELLEAETIKASVLRHRLATFPHKLRAELSGKLHVHFALTSPQYAL